MWLRKDKRIPNERYLDLLNTFFFIQDMISFSLDEEE